MHNASTDLQAQVLLPSTDLDRDMAFFSELGFRLMQIFPDDAPEVAVMTGHDLSIRLDRNAHCAPVTLHLLTDDEGLLNSTTEHVAPNGTILKVLPKSYRVEYPEAPHTFEVRHLRDSDPWVIGRAGMQYLDLLPSRLGGSMMASHIRIPEGGPVPDMVHYHTIGFQLIFCYKGWVRLVYEDQGPPFILEAGDCVTQPPGIRHRVLEASDNLEVIEIGVPAAHMTTIDHDMELPTGRYRPERTFRGQTFCHHRSGEATWKSWRIPGFTSRDTGISKASGGMASVHVIRSNNGVHPVRPVSHAADILFTFVMRGSMQLSVQGHPAHHLKMGEAFVLPPNSPYTYTECSADLELLEVALPGDLSTVLD